MEQSNKQFCDLLDTHIQFHAGASASTLTHIRCAAIANTYHMFEDAFGHRLGYIAWANLNKEAYAGVRTSGTPPKYPYEWNEGRLVLITDVLYRGQSLFSLRRLMPVIFRHRRVVMFCRNNVVTTYRRDGGKFRLKEKKRLPVREVAAGTPVT